MPQYRIWQVENKHVSDLIYSQEKHVRSVVISISAHCCQICAFEEEDIKVLNLEPVHRNTELANMKEKLT